MTRPLLWLLVWSFSGPAHAVPEAVLHAVEAHRKSPGQAAEALLKARTAMPLIGSALAVLEADSRLRAGQRLKARHLAKSVSSDDRWGAWASWTEARAALPDDCRGALRSLSGVRPVSGWVTKAEILDLRIRARTLCGEGPLAEALSRQLTIEHPSDALAKAAYRRIQLTETERLQRALSLEKSRDYVRALGELEALSQSAVGVEAKFHRARIMLMRTRDNFDESARLFGLLCTSESTRTEESCFLESKARGRGGDVVGALSAYAQYRQRYKSGRFADDAEFFSAFLLYETGRHIQARTRFLSIGRGPWKKSARWYAAWTAFLGGQRTEALAGFEAIRAANSGTSLARKAEYWAIRCLENVRPDEAERRAVRLVSGHAFDWYSALLRARYPHRFPSAPISAALPPTKRPENRIFVQQTREIKALADAGMLPFAKKALSVLGPRLRAAGHWRIEADLAAYIGDHRRALRAALDMKGAVLKGRPDGGDTSIWRMAYPRGFQADVEAASAKHGVSPALIYSFIRKESAFEPQAVSHAHALGLMQLLPKTAERIRGPLGIPRVGVGDEDLFKPSRNIDLGTWYVAALKRRFGHQIPLVAAAYNAGPSAVISWFRGRETAAVDIFVESIPFRETREYVKRLTRTLNIYQRLGDAVQESERFRTTLDLTIRPGVSF